MKLVIELDLYGAESPSTEAANVLREMADRIDGHPHFSPGHSQPLFGNGTVGEIGFFAVADVVDVMVHSNSRIAAC